ncbi:MAG: septum formation initiator family protein [Clostridia bacterium]|nr:septum formation initiator family protein [Clostridia bacterium]
MRILKSKKFYKNLFIIALAIYILGIFISQQRTLDSYKNNQEYYAKQIQEQIEYKESLLAKKESLNSSEYIEEVAREKLDMYLPNEKIYIDQDK